MKLLFTSSSGDNAYKMILWPTKMCAFNRFKLWKTTETYRLTIIIIIFFFRLTIKWNKKYYSCFLTAGFEFTENCGWSDDQRQIKSPHKPCKNGTYNNGSHVKCLKCSSCTTPFIACNTTSDTICCKQGYVLFIYLFFTFTLHITFIMHVGLLG